jgi:hypothetical protein
LKLNSLLLITREKPILESIMDYPNQRQYRIYQPISNKENVSIYHFSNSTQADSVDVTLTDYTGSFGSSYLQIYTNINTTLGKVWQEQWYGTAMNGITVRDGTYIQYVIYTPSEVRIIGWDLITGNTTKVITIVNPLYTQPEGWAYNDVSIGFTSSYGSSTLGLVYNSSTNIINSVTFQVLQQNESAPQQYTQLYSTTVSGSQNGVITYIATDNNATYLVKARVDTNKYGNLTANDILKMVVTATQISLEYDHLGIPESFMGVSKERIYTGLAMFVITATAMMYSAGTAAWGGVFLAAIVALTKYLGWFREMSWTIVGFIGVMSVIYLWVNERRKME